MLTKIHCVGTVMMHTHRKFWKLSKNCRTLINGRFRSGFCETIIALKICVNFRNGNEHLQINIQHCALAHRPIRHCLFIFLNVDYYDMCLAVLLKTCEKGDILITALCGNVAFGNNTHHINTY
jgi:hypothetical protein